MQLSQAGGQFRVVLDARMLDAAQRRGIGRSLWSLYDEITRQRPDWQVVLVHRGLSGATLAAADRPNVRERRVQCAGDRWDLWGRLRLPLEAWRLGGHVLHAPANCGPELSTVPLVLTVHDVIPLEAGPGQKPDPNWGRLVASSARRARRILTPSRYSRNQLVERLAVESGKIVVCPWAADPSCRRVDDEALLADIRRRYSIHADRPYVLAFGAADPRKNTAGLIDAWWKIDPVRRRDWLLVLVGIQDSALPAFRTQVRQAGLEQDVVLGGFAAPEDVAGLISAAEVLAFPSLSEGFGLPVLEGFACGTAVLTSNTTSLPEVAGGAAELVDPYDTMAIADGLEQLLVDERLRGDLVTRGYRRATDFTWSASASTTCATLEAAHGQ